MAPERARHCKISHRRHDTARDEHTASGAHEHGEAARGCAKQRKKRFQRLMADRVARIHPVRGDVFRGVGLSLHAPHLAHGLVQANQPGAAQHGFPAHLTVRRGQVVPQLRFKRAAGCKIRVPAFRGHGGPSAWRGHQHPHAAATAGADRCAWRIRPRCPFTEGQQIIKREHAVGDGGEVIDDPHGPVERACQRRPIDHQIDVGQRCTATTNGPGNGQAERLRQPEPGHRFLDEAWRCCGQDQRLAKPVRARRSEARIRTADVRDKRSHGSHRSSRRR